MSYVGKGCLVRLVFLLNLTFFMMPYVLFRVVCVDNMEMFRIFAVLNKMIDEV